MQKPRYSWAIQCKSRAGAVRNSTTAPEWLRRGNQITVEAPSLEIGISQLRKGIKDLCRICSPLSRLAEWAIRGAAWLLFN